MLFFTLALAAPVIAASNIAAPVPFTPTHQRDIACVAVMALHAQDRRRKAPGYDRFPDVQLRGKTWAGIVGDRIIDETGQPQELVGFAMTEAARAEQARLRVANEPASVEQERFNECLPLMEADLAADALVNKPLSKPLPKPQ